ncbi:hypothetical protein D1006_18375 [Burkholderia stabilis]|uniref:Uncharacterized protein n=2 Tax=Burkholderiaceae TaxID=119060 RepID=A0A4Q2ACQ1_9BURK|nr:hypothetical protein D1006_18375 [Burkholderia stabilis]
MQILARFSDEEGLEKAWFNDATHYCAVFDDSTVWAELPPDAGALVFIYGGSDQKVDRLAQQLRGLLAVD